MRTIQYNVYTFDELNEETQKRAIEKCTDHIVELLCEDINASYQPAIKSLEQATKTKLLNWESTPTIESDSQSYATMVGSWENPIPKK